MYVKQQRATSPPKTEYTATNGKTVKIDPKNKTVETIRNQPSTYHHPEARQKRTVEHIHHYHYHHDYGWYSQQPLVFVGGGYSSAFWWMMMEWDAERRARWFYNNQARIEAEAYARGMKDAKVQAYISKWEAEKRSRDSNYVDPEFSKDPSLMYSQNYIEAVYNPTVRTPPVESSAAWVIFIWILVLLFGFFTLVAFFIVLDKMKVRR